MEKIICLTIHTERLHSDSVWEKVESILGFFKKYKVKSTWFSINPMFVGYEYNENKWIKRLNHIKNSGQRIQQHTHFYEGKKGLRKGIGYNLGKENVQKRIEEDRSWIEKATGVKTVGFVSGAFRINDDVFDILSKEGFNYDLTSKRGLPHQIKGLLEIPTIGGRPKAFLLRPKFIKFQNLYFSVIYFHDYDLMNVLFVILLKLQIMLFSILGFKFISTDEIYKKITRR